MTTLDAAAGLTETAPSAARRLRVPAGRVLLAIAVVLAWQTAYDLAGPLYMAAPLAVLQRLVEDTLSGELLRHAYVTLRLSAIGFAIGCAAGVVLPFTLRHLPRLTAAIEPYIMASVGVPKYALMPLFILWFGIDEAPKLWLVGILVFYVVFIAVFAGIRNVDRRLVDMARVAGASELLISREVMWHSLMPFFFAAMKIALPRAISATIVGEFLVGDAGLGWYIENARQMVDTTGVFVGIAVAVIVVLAFNVLLVLIDRRVNAWRPVERDMQL